MEAAAAMERGILRACPDWEVVKLPLADGGEGTVKALVEATVGAVRKPKESKEPKQPGEIEIDGYP